MWRLLLWLRKTSSYWSSQLETAIMKSSGLTGCARLQTYVLIQMPHQAFQVLTEHTIPAAMALTHLFFPKLPRNLAPCHSQEVRGETIAGEGPALQRCRPEVWTDVWVHCHSGMGAGPGAQLRGVALTCPPLSRPHALCVETLNHGEGGLGGATV